VLEAPVEFDGLQGIEIVSQVTDKQAILGFLEIFEGIDEF
jgi:hypothetical protein